MFGFIISSPSTLSDEEKARYHELYCGLCHTLKSRYGQISRGCLTYDLTFYVMLCNSLHEPAETREASRCAVHPARKSEHAASRFTEYAADLTVALAYHKMLDDWRDDKKLTAKAGERALRKAYAKACERIPDQCGAIEASLARIGEIEKREGAMPDEAAIEFGLLMGELFAHGQGIWENEMRKFGIQLGRFIYFMDAAVDYAADEKSGSYNPFVALGSTPENMKTLLAVLIGNASATFEKLPLEQDIHIMRSVLYSGVWQKFNERYNKKEQHD